MWSHPDLEGCYPLRDIEPHEQTRVEPGEAELVTSLHGVASIGSNVAIACRTVVIRFDHGVDWIHFCLPVGSLGYIFDVGAFPFDDGRDLAWRAPIDDWLCGIGRRVFEAVPFELGLVGWDGGELGDATSFHERGVPDERWVGFLVPHGGGLRWFPSNRGAPMT